MPEHPSYRGQVLDAAKDPLDLRDLYYEGTLDELPPWVNNRGQVPFVLDQQKEGACTGFALAAVVNFLLHNKAGAPMLKRTEGGSARMLYEMARRYDEWEGQNYEGSSIRGAMKGWHRHGVCREAAWSYRTGERNPRLTRKRQEDAQDNPLGSYFRVRHLHLNQLHNAIAEVGILLASASVHSGWYEVDATTGQIPYRYDQVGGHAFAIVGYDEYGLWIQNSWGDDWGQNGFAHLSYDDWLQNGYDCWVARLGVKTRSLALDEKGGPLGRALAFDYVPHNEVVMADIRPHFVNLGNDGRLSQSGRYHTDEQDLDEIISRIDEQLPAAGARDILLYAHGGLNDEKASASRIASLLPYFLGNAIYPVHFMWETGLKDAVNGIIEDARRNRRFGGLWDEAKERFLDLLDEAIELATRNLGRPVWSQMKDNATRASEDRGGADLFAGRLAQYQADGKAFNLHLVGHSAGSILLGRLVPELANWGLKVKSFTLYAPACTLDLFEDFIAPHVGSGKCIERLTLFNLRDEYERDDNVAKVYHKSLLYLVSRAFEDDHKKPLLGMERWVKENDTFKGLFGKPAKRTDSVVMYSSGGRKVKLQSASESHGGFDNDVDTLNSTLRIIKGRDAIARPFKETKKKTPN